MSPTFHRSALVGVSMTGTGGLLGGPTVMTTVAVSEAPAGSETPPAVTSPADWYVYVGAAAVESSYWPSPSRSQAKPS